MGDFSEAFMLMFRLLGSGDPELLGIIQLSLQISFGATVLAALIGLPLGAAVEYRKHKRPISGFQAVAGTAADRRFISISMHSGPNLPVPFPVASNRKTKHARTPVIGPLQHERRRTALG